VLEIKGKEYVIGVEGSEILYESKLNGVISFRVINLEGKYYLDIQSEALFYLRLSKEGERSLGYCI